MPVSDSLHTAFPCPAGAGSCWPDDTGFLRHQSPDQSTFQAVSLGEEENGLFPPLEETLHFGSIPELIGFCVSWSLPGTWWGGEARDQMGTGPQALLTGSGQMPATP